VGGGGRVRLVHVLLLAAWLAGCGVAVRSDRAAVGGGPAQATAQAQARIRATAAAAATANPQTATTGQVCECEATGR
jgi:hypothetical protein